MDFFDIFKPLTNRFKKKQVFEDHIRLKTKITLRDHDTGEILYTGHNKVILPGAEFLSKQMFNLPDQPITPSYNTALNKGTTETMDNVIYSTVPENPIKTCLWCVGTDGCGREASQVFEVNYKKWITRETIVPFQHLPIGKDLNDVQRQVYFGRQTTDQYFVYYFKAFDNEPYRTIQFTDGTPIDHTIYSDNTTRPVETFVTMNMSITKFDCRDFFVHTTGINDARVNTIQLCTAWYKEIEGYKYYQDIRPVTKLNFPTEPLINPRKGIDFEYIIYF